MRNNRQVLPDLILRLRLKLKYSTREELQKREGRTLRGRSNASFLVRRLILTIIMAIIALTYQHNFQYEGTRDGVPIYDGSAAGFTDWNFRTKVKWKAAKAEDKSRVMSQIVEGLRGDAADIVRDIGAEDILKEDGLTVLTEALRKHVFPKKAAEAKLLYRHGHKQEGILTRQPSKPIANYLSRRRRWWNQLKTLDPTIEISEEVRGELMLDASNLSNIEKLLVLSSAGNDNKFESLAKAMMDHHALIHLDEKGEKKPWKQPHKGRGWKSQEKREYERKAYVAAHRDVDSDKDKVDVPARDDRKYDDESPSSDMSEAGCYFAQGNEDESDPEPESKEEVELVVFTAYMVDSDAMEEEQVAYLAQTEAAGFVAWNKAKGTGKGK